MKKHFHIQKNIVAFNLAMILATGSVTPAFAAEKSTNPSASPAYIYDEAFYATLDYYGGVTNSSVVKSYALHGNSSIVDYGTYTEVNNLTDDRAARMENGAVVFDFDENSPDHFYFEGVTDEPLKKFPWNIEISYKLNGVYCPAEKLAGEKGVVEILLDVVPNPSASEYMRNNLVLSAVSLFDGDEILSLEAPGAQIQLLGNKRTVLFLVLPGEERHFSIRVGTEDFSYGGMIFTAFPATLAQLEDIKDLREDKEKIEDSYDAINASLDVILDTLDGMSDSLNTVANGLDDLNDARATIYAGKDEIYDSTDEALDDLDIMADALARFSHNMESTTEALTEVTDSFSDLTKNAVKLQPELKELRDTIRSIQSTNNSLKELANGMDLVRDSAEGLTNKSSENLQELGDVTAGLESSLEEITDALANLNPIAPMEPINVGGMTSSTEIKVAVQQAKAAYQQYQDYLTANGLTSEQLPFEAYLQAGGKSPEEASAIAQLLAKSQQDNFDSLLQLMDNANAMLPTINSKIDEINALIASIAGPTAQLTDDMRELCDTLGEEGVNADLQQLIGLINAVLNSLEGHKGEMQSILSDINELGDFIISVSNNADDMLDILDSLNDTLNSYESDAEDALDDARIISRATADAVRSAHKAISAVQKLLKASDDKLNSGTQATLSGLADTLRKSTAGLAQTDTIRAAKETITNLIDDEWNKFTGESNNLLLMDATAKPTSLTSEQNPFPSSIQFIMRTQEIKASDNDTETSQQMQKQKVGVWGKIREMFRDFWVFLTGVY
ncbi:MAG TPA: hypothetical protein GX514_10065 [Thermoanaerobacterales bacterium]|nr:hypothetical protein [Thermoanaerobacterales bacterium]